MREIERQFLCPPPEPGVLAAAERTRIVQGYLTGSDPAVRVRRAVPLGSGAPPEAAEASTGDPRWTLTVKSGSGRVREEVEVAVDAEQGEALLRMAGGRRVEKVRHRIGRWEVDAFEGPLEGLLAAEVELERPEEPLPDAPAGLALGPEVTEETRWTNQSLAHLDPDEARALVEESRLRLEESGTPLEGGEGDPWTR